MEMHVDRTGSASRCYCRLQIKFMVALVIASCCLRGSGHAQAIEPTTKQEMRKSRLIVLTDIGAEVDDTESMIRPMLYSDVIDIKSLIATTSTWKRTDDFATHFAVRIATAPEINILMTSGRFWAAFVSRLLSMINLPRE